MRLPKMILFDYGHTLLHEPGFDFLRGEEKLTDFIKTNTHDFTPEQITTFASHIFSEIGRVRQQGFDLHERQFQKFIYEYLGIEFSVPLEEAEIIQWDAVTAGGHMPGVERMLQYINAVGIRSGVISNIGWSGNALAARINRLLPEHQFEMILASSEYMFRKPHRYIFELALRKANLTPEEVWFCGDNVQADVEGAANIGVFPVWYDDKTVENPWRNAEKDVLPACEHLHIHHWDELVIALGKLQQEHVTAE